MDRKFPDDTRRKTSCWLTVRQDRQDGAGNVAPEVSRAREAEEAVAPRRTVLRGALAATCSLLMPAALLGCSKKEESAPAPPESAPSPAPAMEAAAPPAPVKVSQVSVQYQTTPKDGKKCADCMYFISESNTCKLVEGQISPEGYCVLWVKKT